MNRVLRIGIFGASLGCRLLTAQTDSTRTLSPVEISDSLRKLPSISPLITTFRRDSTGRFPAAGAGAEAILGQAAGVQIRSYGGHGGVKTISLRGFATNQTAVSINDVPYQSNQTGVVNFGNFRADAFDALGISQQPSAAQNPMAGEIQFRAAPTANALRVAAGLGSFGERNAQLYTARVHKRFSYSSYANALSATDAYPFSLNGVSGIRQNAGFAHALVQCFVQYRMEGKGWGGWLEAFSTANIARQGVPSAVVSGNPQGNRDSLRQGDVFSYAKLAIFSSHSAQHIHSLTAISSVHRNVLRYAVAPVAAYYQNYDWWNSLAYSWRAQRQSLSIHAEYLSSHLSGDNLAVRFVPIARIARQQMNVSGLYQRTFSRRSLWVQARANYLAAYGWLPNGSVVWQWNVSPAWELTTNLTYSHRIPAFNELYYFGYGNANLRPEKTQSVACGLRHLHPFATWKISFTGQVFGNITQHKIISLPINPAQWSTFAIGRAETIGAIFSAEALAKHITAYATATIQRATDATRTPRSLLPYTPNSIFTAGARATWQHIRPFANITYSSCRYALLSNTPRSFLPSYTVLEAGISYTMHFGKTHIDYTLSAENLTNTRYEVIRSYPMPPRALRVVIQLRW